MTDRLHDRVDAAIERELRESQREVHRLKRSGVLLTLALVLCGFSLAFALARIDDLADAPLTKAEQDMSQPPEAAVACMPALDECADWLLERWPKVSFVRFKGFKRRARGGRMEPQ